MEVREKRAIAMTDAIAVVASTETDYTTLFEESLELLTSLQEDPNVQTLETKAWELQQYYDKVKVTVRTITITRRLAKLQEARH